MKKFLLYCLFGLLSIAGWAQVEVVPGIVEGIGVEGKVGTKALNISAQLQRRVQETYKSAREVEQISEVALWTCPSDGYLNTISYYGKKKVNINSGKIFTYFEPEELYPHAPSQLTRAEMPDYILAKNNLEVRKWLRKYKAARREVLARLPEFEAAQVKVSHPAKQDAKWLAGQITPHHKYLLLGETHEMEAIPPKIIEIIQTISRQNAASSSPREIFLFTEFLEEGVVWEGEETFDYMPVWQAADKEGISVIGLEPEFVEEVPDAQLRFDIPYQEQDEVENDIWSSVEGVRLRNERWVQTIKQYRAEHPDALFIVYAGLSHVEYTKPYSLGKVFAGPETLVTLMYPEDVDASVIFHTWTNGQFFSRVTQFNRPDLAQLAGFDIGIKIPILQGTRK